MENIILLLIVFLILMVFAIIIILLSRSHNNDLKSAINNDLMNFTKLVNVNMNNLANRLDDMENKINHDLQLNTLNNNQIFKEINEKIVAIDTAQKSINDIQLNITSLQNILQDKKSRGVFGEIELYSLLENVFGINDSLYERQYTLPNNTKADAIIKGYAYGLICVDSKFPLENYRKLQIENTNENRNLFRRDCIKHLSDIKNKYIIEGITADLAFMFSPSEAIYAEIYANFSEVVDFSYKSKVYIVSPTTLMAYLTAIRSIYLNQKRNLKLEETLTLLSSLANEFSRLQQRTETLSKDLAKLQPDFDNLLITHNKIINKFTKLYNGEKDE